MNQQDIIDEMKVLPVIEPEFEIQRRIDAQNNIGVME
jgi:hypothetical protein